jgi:hypothetical protein
MDKPLLQRGVTSVDTCELLKLRRAMTDDTADVSALLREPELRNRLLPLRTKYLALPETHEADTEHYSSLDKAGALLFREAWAVLGTLSPCNPLYLPPIYDNDMLDILVHKFEHAARIRELPEEYQTARDTGHFAIAAEVLMRTESNYYNGSFGTLSTTELYARCSKSQAEVHMEVIVKPPYMYTWLGIACDEIQSCFIEGASTDSKSVQLIKELHSFAKYTVGSLLVLSGSSAGLRTRLFAEYRRAGLSEYPAFSVNLCDYYHVAALRTCEELDRYIHNHYPTSYDVIAPQIPHILHATGGIGRLVDIFIKEGCESRARHSNPRTAFRDHSNGLSVVAGLILRHQSRCDPDKRLEKFIESVAGGRGGEQVYLEPEAVSIPYTDAVAGLRRHLDRDGRDVLEGLVDMGLIYMTSTAPNTYIQVQLSRPADAAAYYVNQPTDDDILRLQLVSMMVTKPELGADASFPLKDLMRTRIHALLKWRKHSGELQLMPGTDGALRVRVHDDESGTTTQITHDNMDALNGLSLRWASEHGLDQVHFTVTKACTEEAASSYGTDTLEAPCSVMTWVVAIDGWQCEGGAQGDSYAYDAGDVAMYRGDSAIEGDCTIDGETPAGTTKSDAATSHLAAVAYNAELGLLEIANALLNSCVSVPTLVPTTMRLVVKLGQLTITTPKSANSAAAEWITCNRTIRIPVTSIVRRKLLSQGVSRIGTVAEGAGTERRSYVAYAVEVHTGTKWLIDCLEETLRNMWPSPPQVHAAVVAARK